MLECYLYFHYHHTSDSSQVEVVFPPAPPSPPSPPAQPIPPSPPTPLSPPSPPDSNKSDNILYISPTSTMQTMTLHKTYRFRSCFSSKHSVCFSSYKICTHVDDIYLCYLLCRLHTYVIVVYINVSSQTKLYTSASAKLYHHACSLIPIHLSHTSCMYLNC